MSGIIASILGGSAAKPIEAVGNVLDGLFTSDDERLSHEEVLTRLAQQPNLAQVELNKVEAAHRSIFVAGWRPAIGWVCALALLYQFVIQPLLAYAMVIYNPDLPVPPSLDFAPLMTVVMALLGLGSLRTVEKLQGRAR
jgi:hypothetical protein